MTRSGAPLNYFTYASVHGPFTIQASNKGLTTVAFEETKLEGANCASALTNTAASELQEYLAGKRFEFDVPLDPQGSSFQKEVWTEVCFIPYGETRTPSEIAERLGKPGSHRSVGTAIRLCTLAPFVPVHRINNPSDTSKQGRLFRAFQALEQQAISS